MEIELFKKSYLPMMMNIIKKYADNQSSSIAHIVLNGDYMQLLKVKHQIDDLSNARMLLQEYPGCDICFMLQSPIGLVLQEPYGICPHIFSGSDDIFYGCHMCCLAICHLVS